MMDVAQQNLLKRQASHGELYNGNTYARWFDVGDLVLMLLPVKKHQMQNSREGSFEVVERVGEVTSDVQKLLNEVAPQTAHINKRKVYHHREAVVNMMCCKQEDCITALLIEPRGEPRGNFPGEH